MKWTGRVYSRNIIQFVVLRGSSDHNFSRELETSSCRLKPAPRLVSTAVRPRYSLQTMAQGTPKTAKAAPAGKRASAAQGSTPNKSPASKADKATASANKAAPSSASQTASSKKRVRLAEDGEATAVAGGAGDEATPSKGSSKKAKSSPAAAKANGAKREEEEATPSQAGATPVKSAMNKQKKAAAASEEEPSAEEATASKGKGKGKGKKADAVVAADEVKLAEAGEDDAEEEEDDEEEEIDFLQGFESGDDDGEDSSDEEAEADEAQKPAFDMKQLPKVKGESVQKKLATKEKKQVRLRFSGRSHLMLGLLIFITLPQAKTGTVYLGRIPKGFYEEEMRSYFSQFGEVTRLRLSRNKQVRLKPSTLWPRTTWLTRCPPNRPAHRSTTRSSSSSTPRWRRLSRRRWTTTSSWDTSSSARSCRTTRSTRNCGSARTASSASCPRRARTPHGETR